MTIVHSSTTSLGAFVNEATTSLSCDRAADCLLNHVVHSELKDIQKTGKFRNQTVTATGCTRPALAPRSASAAVAAASSSSRAVSGGFARLSVDLLTIKLPLCTRKPLPRRCTYEWVSTEQVSWLMTFELILNVLRPPGLELQMILAAKHKHTTRQCL